MANISQFPMEWTKENIRKLSEALNLEPTAWDRYNALFDNVIHITPVRQVACETKCPTRVALHKPGDIVAMEDGRQYEVQDDGKWLRKN